MKAKKITAGGRRKLRRRSARSDSGMSLLHHGWTCPLCRVALIAQLKATLDALLALDAKSPSEEAQAASEHASHPRFT